MPPDLGYGAASSWRLQALQTCCFGFLFTVYGLTLWYWRRVRLTTRTLAWGAVAMAVLACGALPANSSDVLEYIKFGRLLALYHVSPYYHVYSEVTDQFSPYVMWDLPMPYGPVVLPVFAVAGLVSAHSVVLAIYTIKIAWLVVHLANAWLVYRIARRFTPDPEYALFLFAFNPLILMEQLGDGHNDGLLILFGLLALAAIQRGRERLALWPALLGALVKTSGIFCLAAVVAYRIRRRGWRGLADGAVVATAGAACIALAFPRGGALQALSNTQLEFSGDSLHTMLVDWARAVFRALHVASGYEQVFRLDRLIFSCLFLGVCAWRLGLIRDLASVIRETGHLLLALLLGYAATIHPWYMAWPVPVAALTGSGPLRRLVVVASGTALALYAFPYALVEHAVWATLRIAVALGVPIVVRVLDPYCSRRAPTT